MSEGSTYDIDNVGSALYQYIRVAPASYVVPVE